MKLRIPRALLIAMAPLLMATQCEDDFIDSGFETSYLIQNDTSTDLFLLNAGSGFTEVKSMTSVPIGSDLNSITVPIPPSASGVLTDIELFEKMEGDYIRVYLQSPLDDDSWEFRELSENRYEYVLRITDQLLD